MCYIYLDGMPFPISFPITQAFRGWSGGAKVLDKPPVPGCPTIWIIVGQGPIALAVGAGGGCLDIFTLLYPFFPVSPSLWEPARYRLKYCLKGPLSSKQPTNASFSRSSCSITQSCLFLMRLYRMQSSAKSRVHDWTQSAKSLINNRNNNGTVLFLEGPR